MKVDTDQSVYREAPSAADEFKPAEIRRLQFMLRRLRFLETQVREGTDRSGGGMFAVLEIEALEWLLDEIGFLEERP